MTAASIPAAPFDPTRPVDLTSREFCADRVASYHALLDGPAVRDAKISVIKLKIVSRYAECRALLVDPRFIRNRGRARGKADASPLPVPLPKSIAALTKSMIYEDGEEHQRHRALVNKAFTSRSVTQLESRVESLCAERLKALDGAGTVDLVTTYARDVPTRVIAAMMGIEDDEIREFEKGMRVLTDGLSGVGLLRTLVWDLRKVSGFLRELIARKKTAPGDDLLTALIEVEEDGDRLTEDELLAMAFLLIVAGFETTVHQIANGAVALIEHPGQLARLRAGEASWETATEELVRFCGPVDGTKPNYASEDLMLGEFEIPKGTALMPVFGAANRDPLVFDDPDTFDVARDPNPHLGFSFGAHFCLGRPLALMETRMALSMLFDRYPNLALATDRLERMRLPGWNRLQSLPVDLRA